MSHKDQNISIIGRRINYWNNWSQLATALLIMMLVGIALIPRPMSNYIAVGAVTSFAFSATFLMSALGLRYYWSKKLAEKRNTTYKQSI